MTREEFWKKWEPCDWPPIKPSKEEKEEFLNDLDKVIEEEK